MANPTSETFPQFIEESPIANSPLTGTAESVPIIQGGSTRAMRGPRFLATQNSNDVTITGGSISGTSIGFNSYFGILPTDSPYDAPTNGTTDASAALSAAAAAASAADVPLLITIRYAVTDDLSLACDMQFVGTGQLSIATSKTLTVTGAVEAGRMTYLFPGDGTVVLNTTPYVSASWWGAAIAAAAETDAAPAMRAMLGSNRYHYIAPLDYIFRSREISVYPANAGAAVKVRGLSRAVVDRRGASFVLDDTQADTQTAHFIWENNTDIQILGGKMIGNRAGLSASEENGSDIFFSNNRLRLEGGVAYTGDWTILGSPIAGNFNTSCLFDIQEMVRVGIGFDIAQCDSCEVILRKISGGGPGQAGFSNIWDPHFAVTALLASDASAAATTVVVPYLAVTNTGNNGSGAIRLTVGSTSGIISGSYVVSGVVGTTEANGTWYVNAVNNTHVDLLNSTFVNAYVSGGHVTPLISTGDKLAIGKPDTGYQYTTVTGSASSGNVPVTALSGSASAGQNVVDLFYNQTGTNFVEGRGNKLTIYVDPSGDFTTGVRLSTGDWIVDGDISNNKGTGSSVSGSGLLIYYIASGGFGSNMHPTGSVIARGRYADNGNTVHHGYGIIADSASIINGVDKFGPLILDGCQLINNNSIGADVTSTSNLTSVTISNIQAYAGQVQGTIFGATIQQAADPPPSISGVAGLGVAGTATFFGTATGSSGVIQLTAGTGAGATGTVTLTFLNPGYIFGKDLVFIPVDGSAAWITPNVKLVGISATVMSLAWWNGISGGTNLTAGQTYLLYYMARGI